MKKKACFLVAVIACLVFAFTALCACGDKPTDGGDDGKQPEFVLTATISETSIRLAKAESVELTVTVNDPTVDIAWGIVDSKIASITTKGKKVTVRGVSNGTTQITVKNKADGTILATCDVTVAIPKLYINLPYGLVLRGINGVATVKAIATEEIEGDIYWEISDERYVEIVDSQGLIVKVVGKKIGRNPDGDAILTVHYGDESASIPVFVGTKA